MKTYRIENRDSGHIFGCYKGETAEQARDAMAADAGCADYADLCSVVPDDGSLVVTEVEDLVAKRAVLASNLANCEPGGFPGSAAYRRESEAMAALSAFDEAHPEVLQDIRAARLARTLGDKDIWDL